MKNIFLIVILLPQRIFIHAQNVGIGTNNLTISRNNGVGKSFFFCATPKPFDVAMKMLRVTRPGGRIVMGNWIPGDPTLVAQISKISSACTTSTRFNAPFMHRNLVCLARKKDSFSRHDYFL